MFSWLDAVLLRPFPYPKAERLVRVRTFQPHVKNSTREMSLYDFWDYRERNRSFQGLAAYISFANNLTGRGPARSVRMTFTTPELFPVLGVQPLLGHPFTSADDRLNGDVRKVLLSYSLWQNAFHGSSALLGQTIQLRGQGYTVIGVVPPQFQYPDRTEAWVPLMARYSAMTQGDWKRRDTRIHQVLGRLRDGVSSAQASADLLSITSVLAHEYAQSNRDVQLRLVPLREAEAGELRPYIWLVAAAVLLLLAIGCVNVANLLVARAASREREFAVRAALGSRWTHVAWQLWCEGMWFGLLGGLAGLGFAFLGVHVLTALVPVELPAWMQLRIDLRVLAFALSAALLTTVFFGLAPLLQHLRPDLNEMLKQGAKGSSGSRTLAGKLRSGLVIVEVAFSLMLLIGAGPAACVKIAGGQHRYLDRADDGGFGRALSCQRHTGTDGHRLLQ